MPDPIILDIKTGQNVYLSTSFVYLGKHFFYIFSYQYLANVQVRRAGPPRLGVLPAGQPPRSRQGEVLLTSAKVRYYSPAICAVQTPPDKLR